MAAIKDLRVPQRSGERFGYPVKGGVRLFGRAIMAITALGLAVPVGHVDAVAIVGLVEEHVDNRDGADGAQNAVAMRGCFGFSVEADESDIGRHVYAADDATVSLDGTGGRLLLGRIAGIGDGLVWVDLPTERSSSVYLTARIATLVGAGVTRLLAPVAGRIVKVSSVIDGVLTTGNATITAAIDGVAVTNGVITVTQVGSAAGDVDHATPTAANEVEAGDIISLTVGGTNATATPATALIEIAQ